MRSTLFPLYIMLAFFAFSCSESDFIPSTDGDLDGSEVSENLEGESEDGDADEVAQICNANQWSCYDEYSHWKCNENGTDYTNLTLCEAGKVCSDGVCIPPICEVNQWSCYDEYSVWQCNEYGNDYQHLALCKPYEECHDGKCLESGDCEASKWVCSDSSSRQQCNTEGNGWGTPESCLGDDICVDGECVSEQVCTPGSYECYDDKAKWVCAEDGSGFVDPQLCDTNYSCKDGECVSDIVDGDIDGDTDEELVEDGDVDEADFDIDPNGYFEACNNMSNDSLRSCLYNKIKSHYNLGYKPAKNAIFGDIDHQNGHVECVYTGRISYIDSPDTDGMNTEHTWPQSQGAGTEPARADIHHLFPTDSRANSSRGSYPFGVVVNVNDYYGESKRGTDEYGTTVFEPRDQQKGDTARAIFYFSIRYQMSISSHQEAALKQWNRDDPPSEYEKARNEAIYDYQNNYNPFVMRPDFVEMIADF